MALLSALSSSPCTTAMNLSVLGWGRMSKKGLSMPVTHLMSDVLPVLYLNPPMPPRAASGRKHQCFSQDLQRKGLADQQDLRSCLEL